MKMTFVVATPMLGILLGLALPNAAHANTPCRSDCQATYNYCVYSGQAQAACAEQLHECYLECANSFASADAQDAAPAADLHARFLKNAQRRPLPLPKSS